MDSESVMPDFRKTQNFLVNWLPQTERTITPHATHGMQSMNPIAVAEVAYSFFKKHSMA